MNIALGDCIEPKYSKSKFFPLLQAILNELLSYMLPVGEFTENFDKAAGSGTAIFTDKAIQAYFRSV